MLLDQRRTGLAGLFRSLRRGPMDGPHPEGSPPAGPASRVAHHAGIRHVFATASSRPGESVRQGAVDALRAIETSFGRAGLDSEMIRIAAFVAAADDVAACREAVRACYGGSPPVIDVVRQPPADGAAVALEAWAVAPDRIRPEIARFDGGTLAVRGGDLTAVHCSRVARGGAEVRAFDQGIEGFEALRAKLEGAGTDFAHVVRTWLYLGAITGPDGETQRYKELNRARSEFFRTCTLRPLPSPRTAAGESPGPAYPASTGIGAEGDDLVLSALALTSRAGDLRVVPLENPRQTPAFDYAACYSPQSPKFSRAMAVEHRGDAMILVSGTASITRSETRHLDDAAEQTRETLDNIEALVAGANLARHGLPGLGATLEDLAVARVYIKRPADCEAVRAACGDRLGLTPVTYTIADVCRPDLLVEIEGIVFSREGRDR
ncbi:hypothetical protein [Aquisphaera insulae]|uniref:hypothetical protein n=1 Tax=Aquisphaera insulae TaxID=2712864 RepID=UPI0013EC2D5D|nr:hypothetical protein [Aquisphaera insulae]